MEESTIEEEGRSHLCFTVTVVYPESTKLPDILLSIEKNQNLIQNQIISVFHRTLKKIYVYICIF